MKSLTNSPVKSFVGFAGFVFPSLLILAALLPLWAQGLPVGGGTAVGPVMVIPIRSVIDPGLSFFLQRMIRRAERMQAKALILEIDSPGGLVESALEMKNALLRAQIPTIAYVRGRAISAAALIAICCHKIFMEPGSAMGAATPFSLIGNTPPEAQAKFVSAFRGEFEAAAEFRRRDKRLAAAMVDINHDEIMGLVKRGDILTFTPETAKTHGYCDGEVVSVESLLSKLNITPAPLETITPTSMEVFAQWITGPNVSILLFTVGLFCLVLEFLVFGWGLLGWFGLVCIGLFFGGHLFAYLAGFEAILAFLIGVILLSLEIFVIPGFGVTGVLGILSLGLSIVFVFGDLYKAVEAMSKMTALSVVFIVGIYNLAPRLKLFDRFVLKEQLSTEKGFVAVELNAFDKLLNLEGVTVSPCHPSGIVKIGNEKFEVVSDGDFIERNQRVIVIAVEGTKIVVRGIKA